MKSFYNDNQIENKKWKLSNKSNLIFIIDTKIKSNKKSNRFNNKKMSQIIKKS